MEFFDELKQYLTSTQAIDGTVRKQAEAEIRKLRDQDPKKFIATLAKEIANNENPDSLRQMSALILKNFISNRGNDNRYADLWVNLPGDFKEQIKQAALYSLATPSAVVRGQVAVLISTIAKIEIPRKEWLDLIPNLCSNAGNENMEIKNASLQTLEYICEEISPDDISSELKNQVISALITNISNIEANTKSTGYAIKALFNALPIASQNFVVSQERDYIMQKIFEALQHPSSEEIRVKAMMTLVEVGKQEYESIEFYFPKICEITAIAARNDDQTVGAQGIEFWTSLAEEELRRQKKNGLVKRYIEQCHTQLVELLVECTQRIQMEDEDDENDDWGVALSAGCCLDKVAQLIKNLIMQPVISFVSSNITSQNWKQRYSSLLALGAITEGPDKIQFMNVIMPALQNLISMFQDQNGKVREAIAWVMSRICEHHSDVVSNEQAIQLIVPVFINKLSDKPKISNQICHAIENLAQSLSPQHEDQQSNALTFYFENLFNALILNAFRTDGDLNVDLALASFTALSTLCEHSCQSSNNVLYEKLLPILQQIESTLDPNKFTESKSKDFQDYLAGLLQIILVKVGNKLDLTIADNIVKLLIMIFQKQKRVLESGLIAYSGLCNGIGNKVNVKDFGMYIIWALKGDDDECVRLACGLISDLAVALQEQIQQYLFDFVPPLLDILRNPNQDRHSKLQAIIGLGDLCMNCPQPFTSNYINDVLKILQSASKQSLNIQGQENDEDMMIYLTKLRETLIECYTTIVHGVKMSEIYQPLIQYAPTIFEFLQKCVDKAYNPSKEQLRSVLGLIGDMADCIGKQIQPLLKHQFVEQLIITLRQVNDPESLEISNWTFKMVKNSFV